MEAPIDQSKMLLLRSPKYTDRNGASTFTAAVMYRHLHILPYLCDPHASNRSAVMNADYCHPILFIVDAVRKAAANMTAKYI